MLGDQLDAELILNNIQKWVDFQHLFQGLGPRRHAESQLLKHEWELKTGHPAVW